MKTLNEEIDEILNENTECSEKREKLKSIGLRDGDIGILLDVYERKHRPRGIPRDPLQDVVNRIPISDEKTPGSMKCLAIQQPWATLTVAGIKDVEVRRRMVPPCNRFLIAASRIRACEQLCNDELEEKYIATGLLPPYEEWPTGAIIGWVELECATFDPVYSKWVEDDDCIKYVFKDAWMFDKPIYGKTKSTPFFYDVEGIDEDNLPPAHKVKQ